LVRDITVRVCMKGYVDSCREPPVHQRNARTTGFANMGAQMFVLGSGLLH
jgi:hypothetical protein